MQQPVAQAMFRYQAPETTALSAVPSGTQWSTAPTENIPM